MIGSTDAIVPSTVVTEISSALPAYWLFKTLWRISCAPTSTDGTIGAGDLANARLSSGIGRYVWASLWDAEFTTVTCSPPKLSQLAVGGRIERV